MSVEKVIDTGDAFRGYLFPRRLKMPSGEPGILVQVYRTEIYGTNALIERTGCRIKHVLHHMTLAACENERSVRTPLNMGT